MDREADIVLGARELYGERLLGLSAFGSRVAGIPRPDSDLDVGVWLAPPITRRSTWIPWAERFEDAAPTLDPTFFTSRSLERPPGWLLEAVGRGVRILWDPSGALASAFERIRDDLARGAWRRRLYMGLPYSPPGRSSGTELRSSDQDFHGADFAWEAP